VKVQLQPHASTRGSAHSANGANEWDLLRGALAFAHRLEQERRSRTRKLGTVAADDRIGVLPAPALCATGTPEDELQRILQHLQTIMEATGAAIARVVNGNLVGIARRGATAPALGVSENSGCAIECVRTAEPLLCHDAESDAWVDRDACRQLGIRSLVMVPVGDGARVVGMLAAFSDRPGNFDRVDVDAMRWAARALLPLLLRLEEPQDHLPQQASTAAPASELTAIAPAEEAPATSAMPAASAPSLSKGKLLAVLSLVVLAMVAGWYLFVGMQPRNAKANPEMNPTPPAPTLPAAPSAEAAQSATAEEPARSNANADHAFNIRATADGGSTIVVIETGRPVTYEAHTLQNPDRIYLDLRGVEPAPDKSASVLPQPANGPLLKIRTAQSGSVARVALDLKEPVAYVISRETNPERLTIELKPLTRTNSNAPVGGDRH